MHKTRLVRKTEIAEGTMAFYFEKPEDFSYKAGQTIDLSLINPPETDGEGTTRTFSLASDPRSPELMIATRLRDTAFKRVLKSMPEGTELEFEGPYGSFTLHEKAARPAVLLAGGIGITPFHSIVKDAAQKKLPHQITLFYSNRRPEDSAFLEELRDLEKENPNYTLVATMTEMEKSSRNWEGERGYINKEMLARHADQSAEPIYYIAGPATMVTAMREMLNSAGISSDDIRTEEFAGY